MEDEKLINNEEIIENEINIEEVIDLGVDMEEDEIIVEVIDEEVVDNG